MRTSVAARSPRPSPGSDPVTSTQPPTERAHRPAPSARAGDGRREVDTDSLAARFAQAAMAIVLAIVSVLLLLTTHRMQLAVRGAELPGGLLFGAAFQTRTCVLLWAATGARFPLLVLRCVWGEVAAYQPLTRVFRGAATGSRFPLRVLGCLWGVLATPFLGEGAGGGVLLPAVIADVPQLSGWIVQGIGLIIPFLVVGLLTVVGRAR